METSNLNKIFEALVKSPILVGIIMIKDLYYIITSIIDKSTISVSMNVNYFDFIVKLIMAIALVVIFRQYYSMKKQQILNRLFNQVMFEDTFEGSTFERNQSINKTKKNFRAKVEKEFGHEMTVKGIDKLVSDYYNYNPEEIDPWT